MSTGLKKHPRGLPYDPRNISAARRMRHSMTPAESKLWFGFLRDFEYKFYRQRPILHYIADFYCAEFKLVVEVDGGGHFLENGIECDMKRTKAFENIGIKVLRFTNNEVLTNFEGVCECILALARCNAPQSAET